MKSTQRFSVLIWADKRKTDAKGNVPLYRITYLGKRVEISMGRKVDPNKWDPEAGFVKGPGQEVKDINKEIITVSVPMLCKLILFSSASILVATI